MDFSRFLTPKDFFNYYIAGTIWIADLICIIYVTNPVFLNNFWDLYQNTESITLIQTIYNAIILIVIPYVVGFSLGSLSAFITKKLRNAYDGDTTKWVIFDEDDCDCHKERHKGKKLPKAQIDQIEKVIKKTLGYTLKKKYWFYSIRAYVIDNDGEYVSLAARAQHLLNLAESLMLPFPILCSIVTWIIIAGWSNHGHYYYMLPHRPLFFLIITWRIIGWYCISGLVWFSMSWMLFDKYLKMRREWAMHIYRAFLVITAKDKGEDSSYQ